MTQEPWKVGTSKEFVILAVAVLGCYALFFRQHCRRCKNQGSCSGLQQAPGLVALLRSWGCGMCFLYLTASRSMKVLTRGTATGQKPSTILRLRNRQTEQALCVWECIRK